MTSLQTTVMTALLGSVVGLLGHCSDVDAATPDAERVELFAAVDAQQVDLKVVPKDARQATVLIKNTTERPLSIQLPAAFVGMPVLAQNGGNNGGGNNNSGSSSSQSFGGGGMGGGMGMGGMGGGFFDVAPGRVAKVKVATVCLEHGKDDPNPRVAYELRPITDFTDDAAVHEICKMLGRGELDQVSAQAAAWHVTDGLSFQQLAQKIRVQHLNGHVEMYFNAQQLSNAMRAVQVAHHRASEQTDPASVSPGEQADAAQQEALSLNH